MAEVIDLGEFTAEVSYKDIKHIHLSVYPPEGAVRISAPHRMKLDTIRVFAITRLDWIRRQRRKFKEQPREAPREFLNRESHYLWGRRYLLQRLEHQGAAKVQISGKYLQVFIRPSSELENLKEAVAEYYRAHVRTAAHPIIEKWSKALGVSLERFYVQHMKTKWGSCNPSTRTIRLNTELAKKPRECLEYIIVHELVHLLEPSHNERFVNIMDTYMPNWKEVKATLNKLPVKHDKWIY